MYHRIIPACAGSTKPLCMLTLQDGDHPRMRGEHHIWHGEVVPFPPFLTAMYNAADTSAMLYEMATVGVGMCVMVTVCWAIVTVVADAVVKRSAHAVATVA